MESTATPEAELSLMGYNGSAADEKATVSAGSDGSLQLLGATGRAVLFATFRLLSSVSRGEFDPEALAKAGQSIRFAPATALRFWNMWDNLDGTTAYQKNCNDFVRVPRSAFHWDTLPTLRPRYAEMARFLGSIGINSIVLNNVNACDKENVGLMSSSYLQKAAALASVMARYGIAAYLCPCFGSPVMVGNLTTADPLDIRVQRWWSAKVQEATRLMPSFKGNLFGIPPCVQHCILL